MWVGSLKQRFTGGVTEAEIYGTLAECKNPSQNFQIPDLWSLNSNTILHSLEHQYKHAHCLTFTQESFIWHCALIEHSAIVVTTYHRDFDIHEIYTGMFSDVMHYSGK